MRLRLFDGAAVRIAARVAAAWLALALIVIAYFDTKAAAAGWLIGFALWAQILTGSLLLIMIHRLTGGRWGDIAAPVIGPASAAVPCLLVLALPLFVSLPVLYPWLHDHAAVKTDVLSYYLNIPSFVLRSLVALVGWSALAWFMPRLGGRRGELIAALGLVFYALTISGISIDWFLALEPPFTSSSFGASVAIASLLSALALAAIAMPAADDDPAIGDIGGLLLATVLGLTYIDFMAVLVIWYGDLPREEIWFVERNSWLWLALAGAAFIFTSLVPTLALLLSRVRNARRPLRWVGFCALCGLALYNAYLIAAPVGILALLTGFIGMVGIGLGLFGLLPHRASSSGTSETPIHAG